MTPYRQPIRHGDVGLDVYAVKRALLVLGFQDKLVLNMKAGDAFEANLRRLQRRHGQFGDGIYGPATHAIVAPHFDAYGAMLYRNARIRPHATAGYVNPFQQASVVAGRIDMGVDYHGYGPIGAIGDAYVLGLGGAGWPGGEFILYRLRTGEHAGRYIYLAEGVTPLVSHGATVKAGESIARFRWDAAPGRYPGIEMGWGTETVNLTWAAAHGQTGGAAHSNSPAGLAFARLLKRVGAPVIDPGPGPEFPS